MARKKIPENTQKKVLTASRRRCAICYGLNRDISIKKGQIAHLDHNNENNNFDNLAFLCFEHHNEYDTQTSQAKNFTIKEVKEYRNELYNNILTAINTNSTNYDEIRKLEIYKLIIEIIEKNNGVIKNLRKLSNKIEISTSNLEQYLYKLEQQKIIRIDRKKGETKKTISLTSLKENIVIDTFLEQLKKNEKIISELRFVSENFITIDAIINTDKKNYLIDVKFINKEQNEKTLNNALIKLNRLLKKEKFVNYTGVLLIGTNKSNINKINHFTDVKKNNIIIKYIVMNT